MNRRKFLMNCAALSGSSIIASSGFPAIGMSSNIKNLTKQSSKFPILSWHSIDLSNCSLAGYRDLYNDGFTLSLPTIWGKEDPKTTYNANLLENTLNIAAKTNVKVIAGCYELATDTETTVKRFMNSPALAGWFLKDEPSLSDYPTLADLARKIKAIDPNHFVYVNMRPSDAKPMAMGTSSYDTYINEFLQMVPVDFLSFDKYPCMVDKDGNLYVLDGWFNNLQIIADAAKKAGKDFWAFASSTKFETVQATPTLATMRLQMYTNLAYGAQGLQYFVYKNPSSPVYADVRQLNNEIQNFAKVFLGAKVISVTQTGQTIPSNTERFEKAPDVIKMFKTGNAGAVVSVLEKGDREFFVVVSRDIKNVLPVTIEIDKSVQQVSKNGTLINVQGKVTEDVLPGDILVYSWNK